MAGQVRADGPHGPRQVPGRAGAQGRPRGQQQHACRWSTVAPTTVTRLKRRSRCPCQRAPGGRPATASVGQHEPAWSPCSGPASAGRAWPPPWPARPRSPARSAPGAGLLDARVGGQDGLGGGRRQPSGRGRRPAARPDDPARSGPSAGRRSRRSSTPASARPDTGRLGRRAVMARRASSSPCWPVQALALPEHTTTPRASAAGSRSRQSTGARRQVGGEHPGGHRPRVADHQGQVGRVRGLEPAADPGRPEPGRRRDPEPPVDPRWSRARGARRGRSSRAGRARGSRTARPGRRRP